MTDTSPALIQVNVDRVYIIHHGASQTYTIDELILFVRKQYDSQVAELNEALDALTATGNYVRAEALAPLDAATQQYLKDKGFTYVTTQSGDPDATALTLEQAGDAPFLNAGLHIPSQRVSMLTGIPAGFADDRYMPTPTPFSLPPIIQAKVTPSEYLGLLRSRLNKGYMPSADGSVQYNSKPYYLRGVDSWLNNFQAGWYEGTGCYVDESVNGGNPDTRTKWAFVHHPTSGIETLCNLKTDQLWVRLVNTKASNAWCLFDHPVAIDRLTLDTDLML